MTEAVHGRGGKIVLQISHAGFYAYAKWIRQMPLAPSDVKGLTKSPRKEMSSVDIQEVAEAFGQAAERAQKAGFDGVQIHAAHGYLLSQFLSPVFNKREDLYGGTVENRARFLLEVLLKIKATLGPDYPILVKMNSQDFVTGGLTLDDSLQVGLMLFESGIYAIELSGGTHVSGKLNPARTGITSENKEAYFRDAGKAFKKKMDIPIILVGGIRSYHVAERIAEEGVADYISMSRPLIREPGLIKRWKAGDRRKSTCISDNQCFNPATAGEGMHCVVERKQKKDRHDE
jgi:2,4-dienoyl-CoA reductase-like NADH-dependent reductase (Old Yellow Enzyme family)